MYIPTEKKALIKFCQEIIHKCSTSRSNRAMAYRSLKQWRFTGSGDNSVAIYNRLNCHIDRLTSYLYSPADLRFFIEYENSYPKIEQDKAEVAAHYLTRKIESCKVDMKIGAAVDTALWAGYVCMKPMWGNRGLTAKIVMPWSFGVYREDINDLDDQEAMEEVSYITLHDLWRRVGHRPDRLAIMKRAKAHAVKKTTDPDSDSYFHQVLLAAQPPAVQTTAGVPTQPGGLIQVTSDPIGGILSPEVLAETVCFHELTVLNDETGDYTTIQFVDPDIVIEPYVMMRNLYLPHSHPYVGFCPNYIEGILWGRSEMADLLNLQGFLKERVGDIKKTMSLQYDRRVAFLGMSGDGAEMYDQLKEDGWMMQQDGNGKVQDLTPPLPKEAFEEIEGIIAWMNEIGGFNNILSGQGEPGVRAGNHAQTLIRTASPRLRDRAISIERSIGELGEKCFELLKAKDATTHFINPEDENTGFLLSQLPDDCRVMVDSHTSSPIYEEDHLQLAAFLEKAGVIDGQSVLDLINVPMKELLKQRYAEMQKQKAELLQKAAQNPELAHLLESQGKKSHK